MVKKTRVRVAAGLISFGLLLSRAALAPATETKFAANNDIVWKLIGPGDVNQVSSLSVDRSGRVYAGTDIGGIYASDDNGNSWRSLNEGLKNYDVTTPVLIDRDNAATLYCGTRGGFYKSTDGGKSWRARWRGLGRPSDYFLTACIGSLCLAPDNTLYLGLGYRPQDNGTKTVQNIKWKGHIFKSTDKGESWVGLTPLGDGVKIKSIAVGPPNSGLLYSATDKGLFVSSDGGTTWQNKFKYDCNMILIHPKMPDILYLTCGKYGVYKSPDAGQNWHLMDNGLNFYKSAVPDNYSAIVQDRHNLNVLYLLNSSWGMGGGVYKTADGGLHWDRITRWVSTDKMNYNVNGSWLEESRKVNTIVLVPNNPERIFIGTSRYIYKSSDGGNTWRQVISQKIISQKSAAPEINWTHRGINNFGSTNVLAVDPFNSDNLFIGTGNHGLLKSSSAGKSWRLVVRGMQYKDSILDVAISRQKAGLMFVINRSDRKRKYMVSKSIDGGESWEAAASGLPKDAVFKSLLMNPADDNILYLAGNRGVYKTIDGGGGWFGQSEGLSGAGVVHKLVRHPQEAGTIFAAAEKGIYKTINAGKLWNKVCLSDCPKNVYSIAIDPGRPATVYAGCISRKGTLGGVFKSTDMGKTWKHILKVKKISSLAIIPNNSSIIYALSNDQNYHDESSGAGLFRSENGGVSWQSVNNGLAVKRGYNITVERKHPYKIYLSTNGSGAYVAVDPEFLN